MAIEPSFLAALRRQHRCELILFMVQLEQLIPGWWASLHDFAEQLGTDRSTLNHSLIKLERRQLIRHFSIGNRGGTWCWWVKRNADDHPSSAAEPSYAIKDLRTRCVTRIPISGRAKWAARHGIPYSTVRGFLSGQQLTLQGRWVVTATPFDHQCQS